MQNLKGRGIPCLVLVDADGRVLSHSYSGDEYLGPDRVLDFLVKILTASRTLSFRNQDELHPILVQYHLQKNVGVSLPPQPYNNLLREDLLPQPIPQETRVKIHVNAEGRVQYSEVIGNLSDSQSLAIRQAMAAGWYYPAVYHGSPVSGFLEMTVGELQVAQAQCAQALTALEAEFLQTVRAQANPTAASTAKNPPASERADGRSPSK